MKLIGYLLIIFVTAYINCFRFEDKPKFRFNVLGLKFRINLKCFQLKLILFILHYSSNSDGMLFALSFGHFEIYLDKKFDPWNPKICQKLCNLIEIKTILTA